MRTRVIKLYSECFKRQAGSASQDSCSKIQMLNAKCSVLNALHPRYPPRSFTPCAPGRFFSRPYYLDDETGPRIARMTRIPGKIYEGTKQVTIRALSVESVESVVI